MKKDGLFSVLVPFVLPALAFQKSVATSNEPEFSVGSSYSGCYNTDIYV